MPQSKTFHGTSLPFLGFNSETLFLQPGDKEMFCDKPNLSTLSKTLEAMKTHASMNGISTIAVPKLGCGLDQMNWQEVVKLLQDLPPPPGTKHKNRPPAENDRRPEREPEGPTVLQNRRTRRAAPAAPFLSVTVQSGKCRSHSRRL